MAGILPAPPRAPRETTAGARSVASGERCAAPAKWEAWSHFASSYIEPSGRVVDPAAPRRITVSEGQAYALFFALVARDREAFERILRWTEDNLAAGDLRERLPGWHWGRRDDGTWGLLDANSASDADLWMVYTLAHAARVWGSQRHAELSRSLGQRLLREVTVRLPGLGLVLLPGPQGFGPDESDERVSVRLNPSYFPLPVLQWLASQDEDPRWRQVLRSSSRIVELSASRGFAPDWVHLTVDRRQPDPLRWALEESSDRPGTRLGSYDAVRVYLWLGLMAEDDPVRRRLLGRLDGMARALEKGGGVPEKVDVVSGDILSTVNPHLGWALLPYLRASGREKEFRDLAQRLRELGPRFPAYYEDALRLFAAGHLDRWYRFDAQGALDLMGNPCSNVSRFQSLRLH